MTVKTSVILGFASPKEPKTSDVLRGVERRFSGRSDEERERVARPESLTVRGYAVSRFELLADVRRRWAWWGRFGSDPDCVVKSNLSVSVVQSVICRLKGLVADSLRHRS